MQHNGDHGVYKKGDIRMKNLVWLVSYPKSGSTWFRVFLTNYLNNKEEPVTLKELVKLEKIGSTLVASDAVLFEEITGLNPFEMPPDEVAAYRPDIYRFISDKTKNINYIKIHDAYVLNKEEKSLFPSDISRAAVYFVRNPLDVCVSYSNHSATEIEIAINFLLNETAKIAVYMGGPQRQVLLSWKGHVESWRNQKAIPIHFVRYEDMKQNPIQAFRSVIQFLELEYDEERLIRSIRHSDFKLLQQMEIKNGFNEKMQLCESFFWKGEIGNYRNHLSEKEIQRIVNYNFDTMKTFGYIDSDNQLTI